MQCEGYGPLLLFGVRPWRAYFSSHGAPDRDWCDASQWALAWTATLGAWSRFSSDVCSAVRNLRVVRQGFRCLEWAGAAAVLCDSRENNSCCGAPDGGAASGRKKQFMSNAPLQPMLFCYVKQDMRAESIISHGGAPPMMGVLSAREKNMFGSQNLRLSALDKHRRRNKRNPMSSICIAPGWAEVVGKNPCRNGKNSSHGSRDEWWGVYQGLLRLDFQLFCAQWSVRCGEQRLELNWHCGHRHMRRHCTQDGVRLSVDGTEVDVSCWSGSVKVLDMVHLCVDVHSCKETALPACVQEKWLLGTLAWTSILGRSVRGLHGGRERRLQKYLMVVFRWVNRCRRVCYFVKRKHHWLFNCLRRVAEEEKKAKNCGFVYWGLGNFVSLEWMSCFFLLKAVTLQFCSWGFVVKLVVSISFKSQMKKKQKENKGDNGKY